MIATRCAHFTARATATLALAAGEVLDGLSHRLDADLELLHVACRLAAHRPFREHAQGEPERSAPPGLSPQEDVRGDVERGSDGEILIDGLDPCAARIAWSAEADALAV